MYQVIIMCVAYLIVVTLPLIAILLSMMNMRNQIQERINDGAYVQGTLTNKGELPKNGKLFKRYYGCIDNIKYRLMGYSEFNELEIGKVYYFILSEKEDEAVIVKKDIKKYTHKVTLLEYIKEVIKQTTMYNKVKSSR